MSDATTPLWWVFVAAFLAAFVLLVAFGIALLVYQRRFLALHRDYASQLLTGQDEERAWVAREVHDDALQRIALLDQECERLAGSLQSAPQGRVVPVGAIRAEIKDLGVVLRSLAHRLHPALLDKGGLNAALTSLAGEIERGYDLRVKVTLPAELPKVTGPQALAIYRIAQEALRNAGKHSGVPEAELDLDESGESYVLTISDKGRGFDTRAPRRNTGLGLIAMSERAFLAQGQCTVSSRADGGTVVEARFPRLKGNV
ncbi:MAG TPA: ATP-binding protein [Gemmatimonadales bacterium]|nr:ATP-binding protein [Gemmatimonadales bacterium]